MPREPNAPEALRVEPKAATTSKALLGSAPLDGIDLNRDWDHGREDNVIVELDQ